MAVATTLNRGEWIVHCADGSTPPLLLAHTVGMDYLAGLGRTSPDTTLIGFARAPADPTVTPWCAPTQLGAGAMRVVQIEVDDSENMRADGKGGRPSASSTRMAPTLHVCPPDAVFRPDRDSTEQEDGQVCAWMHTHSFRRVFTAGKRLDHFLEIIDLERRTLRRVPLPTKPVAPPKQLKEPPSSLALTSRPPLPPPSHPSSRPPSHPRTLPRPDPPSEVCVIGCPGDFTHALQIGSTWYDFPAHMNPAVAAADASAARITALASLSEGEIAYLEAEGRVRIATVERIQVCSRIVFAQAAALPGCCCVRQVAAWRSVACRVRRWRSRTGNGAGSSAQRHQKINSA